MISNLTFPRRQFIKTFTFAAAYSSLLGKEWNDTYAAEISLQAATTLGTLRIKLSSFPALQAASGSVRLAVNPLRADSLPDGQFHPVIINRGPNDVFYALNSRCTHQNCAVFPLEPFSNQMSCPCHGSLFAIDGRRLSGLATSSLAKYTVKFDGQDGVEVQIPNLGYSVIGSTVQSGASASSRFRLDFRALRNVEYEVQFRESLDKAAAVIPFTRTEDGVADLMSFTATSAGNVSLFVDRKSATGFYGVAIKVSEI